MSDLYKWWYYIGWVELNKVLIEILGKGVGYIPITNLIEIPENCDLEELAKYIVNDGVSAKIKDNMLWIYAY